MGTVVERNGRYRAMVRVTGHKPQYKTFDTARAAKKWVRDTETEFEGQALDNPDIKLPALIERYVAEIAPKRKMAASHLGHDIPSIMGKFDSVRLSDLRGRGLVDWALRQPDTLSPSTLNWIISRLCGVLRQAEHHWGVSIPWADVEKAKRNMMAARTIAVGKPRSRRVSDTEMAAIKSAIGLGSNARYGDMLDFCLVTAMRISEVCRLRRADFSEAQRTVIIRDRKHPTQKFGNDQTIPLLGGSVGIILRQPRDGELIFGSCPTYVSKVFKLAARKAGVEGVVLHDLRHEAISRMFEMGFQIQEVSLVSGHRDWKQLRRYTHLTPAHLVTRERELRGEVFTKVGTTAGTTVPTMAL